MSVNGNFFNATPGCLWFYYKRNEFSIDWGDTGCRCAECHWWNNDDASSSTGSFRDVTDVAGRLIELKVKKNMNVLPWYDGWRVRRMLSTEQIFSIVLAYWNQQVLLHFIGIKYHRTGQADQAKIGGLREKWIMGPDQCLLSLNEQGWQSGQFLTNFTSSEQNLHMQLAGFHLVEVIFRDVIALIYCTPGEWTIVYLYVKVAVAPAGLLGKIPRPKASWSYCGNCRSKAKSPVVPGAKPLSHETKLKSAGLNDVTQLLLLFWQTKPSGFAPITAAMEGFWIGD